MTPTSISPNEATVASRYLAGQLSDTERAAFEARLRDDPAVLREVEATARLKVGLARLRERGELDALLAPPVWSQKWFALATAAALVMIVMGVMLSRFEPRNATRPILAASIETLMDTQGNALAVTSTLVILRKRSETYDAVLEYRPAGAVELRVLPDTPAESGRYRVSLARTTDDGSLEPVARVDGLRPAEDGFVTMYVDASKLAAGRYRLAVIGDVRNGDASAADTFVIRVQSSKNN